MKAMKTVIKAMTRTKETTVMVPMKMSSCLIWSSEMTCCSATASLLAIKELLRGPASMALERLNFRTQSREFSARVLRPARRLGPY